MKKSFLISLSLIKYSILLSSSNHYTAEQNYAFNRACVLGTLSWDELLSSPTISEEYKIPKTANLPMIPGALTSNNTIEEDLKEANDLLEKIEKEQKEEAEKEEDKKQEEFDAIFPKKSDFKCIYCNKPHKRNGDLKRHIQIHTHEKNFSCDKCYRSFTRDSDLTRHKKRIHIEKTHRDIKIFPCQLCNQKFTLKSIAEKHQMLIHHDKKKYKCDACISSFVKKIYLKTHKALYCKNQSTSNNEANMY